MAIRHLSGLGVGCLVITKRTGEPAPRPVRVFVSYSHDSSDHSARVLGLTQRLRREGLDATIDQFALFPKEGWIRWMHRQLSEADFTLCVCTENYRVGFDGLPEESGGKREESGGKGVNWEGQTISQFIYDDRGENARFIPVIFAEEEGPDVIPRALKPYTHFILDQQYDELYSLLTSQPAVSPEPLGAVRQSPVISSGVPSATLPLDAAGSIESRIRLIAAGPGKAAEAALDQLEQIAQSPDGRMMTDAVIRQLVSYISAIEASSTYPLDERLLRKSVVRTLIRLTGGKLNKYLSGQALSGIDLALFDFRGTDMAGVDFSGSFMIECDFSGVNLSRSSFVSCRIRNVRFDHARLDGVDFTGADWFNALGLTASQFASSRINTLLPSPVSEEGLHAFLDQNYTFKFMSWGSRIQGELRHAWATYLQPGGLADEVARWAESFDLAREAIRELDEQSDRFKTYQPITGTRRVFLDYTFLPNVRRSLEELECVNPAEWPDPGWAVDFSAMRDQAVRKLASAEANLNGESTQQIMELLSALGQLREKIARNYPWMLDP